jgi:hypothetical protein
MVLDHEDKSDVVYHGYGSQFERTIMVESTSGEPLHELRHIVQGSPGGMSWG